MYGRYAYLSERFPSTIRSTGFGLAMGIGRAGGPLSSAAFALVTSKRVAFMAFGTSYALGALVALSLRVETASSALVDVVGGTASKERAKELA